MKITQVITNCALAAGLMCFTTGNVQAASQKLAKPVQSGYVIDNVLYSPISLQLTVKYVVNEKVKLAGFATKDVLNIFGFPSNFMLALGPGNHGRDFDVYVITPNTVIEDLSHWDPSARRITLVATEMLHTEAGTPTTQTIGSEGRFELYMLNQDFTENYVDTDYFEIIIGYDANDEEETIGSGLYSMTQTFKLINGGGAVNGHLDFTSIHASGGARIGWLPTGFDDDDDNDGVIPVQLDGSAHGSGTVVMP